MNPVTSGDTSNVNMTEFPKQNLDDYNKPLQQGSQSMPAEPSKGAAAKRLAGMVAASPVLLPIAITAVAVRLTCKLINLACLTPIVSAAVTGPIGLLATGITALAGNIVTGIAGGISESTIGRMTDALYKQIQTDIATLQGKQYDPGEVGKIEKLLGLNGADFSHKIGLNFAEKLFEFLD